MLNLNTYIYIHMIYTSSYVKSREVFSASRCRRSRFHSLGRLQPQSKSPVMSTSASLFCDNTRDAAVRLREKSWSIARIRVVIAGGIRRQPQHLPALLQCLWLNVFLGSHVTGERQDGSGGGDTQSLQPPQWPKHVIIIMAYAHVCIYVGAGVNIYTYFSTHHART